MPQDNLYSKPQSAIQPFVFDQEVANVFDDMIQRSVPNYLEMQRSVSQLAKAFVKPNTTVWDLGCSTGTTLLMLHHSLSGVPTVLCGLDNSRAMINQCKHKLASVGQEAQLVDANSPMPDLASLVSSATFHPLSDRENHHRSISAEKGTNPIFLYCQDIEFAPIESASVVIINYTLQFTPVAERLRILRGIVSGMAKDSLLIISEKVTHADPVLDEAIFSLHHRFKYEQGYSKLEISQKREALENVLIPLSPEENLELIRQAGLADPQILCKQLNFATFVARRK